MSHIDIYKKLACIPPGHALNLSIKEVREGARCMLDSGFDVVSLSDVKKYLLHLKSFGFVVTANIENGDVSFYRPDANFKVDTND